jgi:hypothetical protein
MGKNCDNAEFLFLRISIYDKLNIDFWSILATFATFLKHLKYHCKALQSVFNAFGVFLNDF